MPRVPSKYHGPGAPYTINIPGIQDVIRIPALDDKRARFERLTRMSQSHDPLPDSLSWLPSAMHHVDTAEDLIFTVGYPLLQAAKLFAPDLIPYVGWILLGDQILEVLMALIGAPMIGTLGKTKIMECASDIAGGTNAVSNRALALLEKGAFTHWAISALKTLYRFTGYGLNFGPVLAAATSGVWGIIRALGGKRLVVHGPPSTDVTQKAFTYLLSTPSNMWLAQSLDPMTNATLLIAHNIATNIVAPLVLPHLAETIPDDFAMVKLPAFQVWYPATAAALEDAGFDPNKAHP